MAVIKGFRILITSDSGGNNVIADLGIVALPILKRLSNIPGFNIDTRTQTHEELSPYVDDPAVFGNVLDSSSLSAERFTALQIAAPLVTSKDLVSYTGGYIKLLNDTGFFAMSRSPISGDAYTGLWDLYNDSGSQVAYADAQGFPFSNNVGVRTFIFDSIDNDGNISGTAYILSASQTSSNYYMVQIGSYAAPYFPRDAVSWLNSVSQYVPPPTDPYTQGGESDTGGGTGNFDGTSVDVDFASLPSISAVDTGFISLYNPTLAQLQSLANYMWSDLFDLDTFKKLFGDPMQAILGLSIVPGPVPNGGSQVVKVGNISTGINMTKAATQYINIDCGTLNVEEFWGAYLDYEPYTKAEIYLPFIGVHQIAVDDIMNKPVHIMYHIDLLSGGCACEIKCGGSVLYTFIGSCAVSIPVTGSDWTNLINGVLSAASAIGTMVATGGATAPAAAGEIASAAVNSLKPSIEKSGSVAGAGGLLAGKVPVLILTRPRQALPGKQNTFTGYPAFITRSLGALSGYTEVHSIRLSGIDGTESEIDEIEELLKGGVIL